MTTPTTPVVPATQPSKANGINETTAAPTDLSSQLAALQKERDEYRQKVEAADKKLRVNAIEMKKFADDKKGIGAKLSAYEKMSKALEASGLTPEDLMYLKTNPDPALRKALGEDYYNKLVELRINGGALPAEVLPSLLERVKSDIRNEFEEKAAKEKTENERRANEAAQHARHQLTEEAGAFLEKSWSDYPIFEGNPKQGVARAIASYIENEFHRTGKVLTNKEAADAIEGAEIARAERLAGIEKYRAKLTEKLKPAIVPTTGAPLNRRTEVERRTLSNDLTATSQAQKRTQRTDEERMQAILAMQLGKG